MYYTTQKEMNLLDAKAIFGWVGTTITAFFTYIQTTFYLPDWIPIIPAIATAIYMLAKAYVHVTDGGNRGKKDIDS